MTGNRSLVSIEKNIQDKKLFKTGDLKKYIVKRIFLLGGMILPLSGHSQAAESTIFGTLYNYGSIAFAAVTSPTVYETGVRIHQYCKGTPKTFENQLYEFTSNRDKKELEQLITREKIKIEGLADTFGGGDRRFEYQGTKDCVKDLKGKILQYEASALAICYTYAGRDYIVGARTKIDRLKDARAQMISSYLDGCRLNLGCALYHHYHTDRAGGAKNRLARHSIVQSERFQDFGVYDFPEVRKDLITKDIQTLLDTVTDDKLIRRLQKAHKVYMEAYNYITENLHRLWGSQGYLLLEQNRTKYTTLFDKAPSYERMQSDLLDNYNYYLERKGGAQKQDVLPRNVTQKQEIPPRSKRDSWQGQPLSPREERYGSAPTMTFIEAFPKEALKSIQGFSPNEVSIPESRNETTQESIESALGLSPMPQFGFDDVGYGDNFYGEPNEGYGEEFYDESDYPTPKRTEEKNIQDIKVK